MAKHGLANAKKSYISFKKWLWISVKRDTPLPALGSLCQRLANLTVKKCLLMFRWSLLCLCSSCPLCLVLSLGTIAKECLLCALPSGICIHWWGPHEPSLLQAAHFHLSQPCLLGEMLQPHNHLGGPSLYSPVCPCLSCIGDPRTGHSTHVIIMREFQTFFYRSYRSLHSAKYIK